MSSSPSLWPSSGASWPPGCGSVGQATGLRRTGRAISPAPYPAALREPGIETPVAAQGSQLVFRGPSPSGRKWPPSPDRWSLLLTPDPLQTVKHTGRGSPPQPSPQGIRTQPASPSVTPPDGAVPWAAGAEAGTPPCPSHLRHRPRESLSRWPEVPSGPQTQGQVAPGWAVHVGAASIAAQGPSEHKAT